MRPHRVEIRLNADEKARMLRHAKERGLPLAVLARAAVLGEPMPLRPTNIEAEAVVALNRVGSNINQIARAANAGTLTPRHVQILGKLVLRISTLTAEIRIQVRPVEETDHAEKATGANGHNPVRQGARPARL